MVRHAPKPFPPDASAADVLVAIQPRAERGFRVVGVDRFHVIDPDRLVDFRGVWVKLDRSKYPSSGCRDCVL